MRSSSVRLAAIVGPVLALPMLVLSQTPVTEPQTSSGSQAPPQPFVLIDAAHGGTDSGAELSAAFPEKDITLVLARRLNQELIARGIPSQLLRDADTTLSFDQRAAAVNAARPALYLVIHVTSQTGNLRVYTAMLPVAKSPRGPFLNWETAQATMLARSRSLQAHVAAALQQSGTSVRVLAAPLRPLNNVTVPAVAVEIGPVTNDVSQLATPAFQEMICSSIAKGLALVKADLVRSQ